ELRLDVIVDDVVVVDAEADELVLDRDQALGLGSSVRIDDERAIRLKPKEAAGQNGSASDRLVTMATTLEKDCPRGRVDSEVSHCSLRVDASLGRPYSLRSRVI